MAAPKKKKSWVRNGFFYPNLGGVRQCEVTDGVIVNTTNDLGAACDEDRSFMDYEFFKATFGDTIPLVKPQPRCKEVRGVRFEQPCRVIGMIPELSVRIGKDPKGPTVLKGVLVVENFCVPLHLGLKHVRLGNVSEEVKVSGRGDVMNAPEHFPPKYRSHSHWQPSDTYWLGGPLSEVMMTDSESEDAPRDHLDYFPNTDRCKTAVKDHPKDDSVIESMSMSVSEIYKEAYIRLGSRDLSRVTCGYDPARQRDLGPGRPTVAIVSNKAYQLIAKLESLWDPSLSKIVLKVSYLSGSLYAGHFLSMGTNLILCDLMDYYTVDLWVQGLADQIKRPVCIFCSSDGTGDLLSCAACRQVVYCSEACQKKHWRSSHSKKCKVIGGVYQTSKLEQARHSSDEKMALIVEIFKVSMKLVEEAEHQLYNDNDGSEWLLLQKYKMPPFARTDLVINCPLMVYHPYLYQSVDWFRPRMTKGKGYLDRWGLPLELEHESGDPQEFIKLSMNISNIGLPITGGGPPCQQIQFVEKLIERKKNQLEKTRRVSKDSPDFILRIELMNTKPKVWRKFQCPSNIPLFTLADKILTPVMGWVRNFHAYTFVDLSDGAHFGPSEMDISNDTMHIKMNFYKLMDDCDVQLGQLVQKVGDKLVWVYDLGDYWEHMITVERVVKPTGVTLIDGEMSCPPENEKAGWQEDVLEKLPPINKWDGPRKTPMDEELRYKLYQTINSMVNLKESGQYILAKDGMYDPYYFNIEHHLKMLKDALASNVRSKTDGGKTFSLDVDALVNQRLFIHKTHENDNPHSYKAGYAPRQTENGMFENVPLKRDSKDLALCGNCGSTRNLLICRGCKQIYYCGDDCQREHWTEGGHEQQCNLLKQVHKSVKEEEKGGKKSAKDQRKEGKKSDKSVKEEEKEGNTLHKSANEEVKTGKKSHKSAKEEEEGKKSEATGQAKNVQSKDLSHRSNHDANRVTLLVNNLKKKGNYFQNEKLQRKFMICAGYFNDEELSSLEEVESFSQLNKLCKSLYFKYGKLVSVAEEMGDSMQTDSEEMQKLTEGLLGQSSKNKGRNKKDANKRKLRRKML